MIKKFARIVKFSASAAAALALSSAHAVADEGSANKLDNMISPITNPINFEDPRISTEVRPLYVYHDVNDDFITTGGEVQAVAAQARIALTDRLALIATKDGALRLRSDEVLADQSGALNLEGGLKYAAYMNKEDGQIVSLGLKYQAATGSPRIFQGQGEGLIIPFVSAAAAVGPVNVIGETQLRDAVSDTDSSFWDVSLHADYPIENFYPTVELNMFHVYEGGDRLPLPGEGADVLDIGASGAAGDTTVNMAVGLRYRLCKYADFGVGYEFPLTSGDDVFGQRMVVDFIVKAPDWTLF